MKIRYYLEQTSGMGWDSMLEYLKGKMSLDEDNEALIEVCLKRSYNNGIEEVDKNLNDIPEEFGLYTRLSHLQEEYL
jgi:hypothetical protein